MSSNNNSGIHANSATSGAISVAIDNSNFSLNTGNGIAATGGAGSINILVDGTTSSDNGAAGIRASGATAIIRLSNSNVFGNTNGLTAISSGQILSFANNRIRANTVDGAPTGTLAQQ